MKIHEQLNILTKALRRFLQNEVNIPISDFEEVYYEIMND